MAITSGPGPTQAFSAPSSTSSTLTVSFPSVTTQALVWITFYDTNSAATSVLSETNGTFTLLARTTGFFYGDWLVNELWMGNFSGTPGATFSYTSSTAASSNFAGYYCQFSGINPTSPVESITYAGTASSVSSFGISGVSTTQPGDMEFATVAYIANTTQTGWTFPFTPTLGQVGTNFTIQGSWAVDSSTTTSHTDSFSWTTPSAVCGFVVVLSAYVPVIQLVNQITGYVTNSSSVSVTPVSPSISSGFLVQAFWTGTSSNNHGQINSISMTNTTGWTKLIGNNSYNVTPGTQIPTCQELWYGYATGLPSGSLTASLSITSGGGFGLCVSQFTGIATASAYEIGSNGVTNNNSSSTNTNCSSGSVTVANFGDLEFVSTACSYYNGAINPVATTAYCWTNGQSQSASTLTGGTSFKIWCSPAPNHADVTTCTGFTNATMIGVVAVLKALVSRSKTFNESYTLTDTKTIDLPRHSILLNETYTLSDSYTKQYSGNKTLTDPYTLTEVFSKNAIHRGNFVDPFSMAESSTRTRTRNPKYTDTFTLADSIVRGLLHNATLSDSYPLLDSITTSTSRTESFVELLNLIEAYSTSRALSPAFIDSYSLLDSIGKSKAASTIFNDLLTLIEVFAASHLLSSSFSDVFSLLDSISNSTGRTFGEILTLLDSFLAPHSEFASFTELLVLTETYASTYQQFRNFSDTFSLIDAFHDLHQQTATFSDLLSIVETYSQVQGGAHIFSESFSLVDSYFRQHNSTESFTDTFTLIDSRQLVRDFNRTLSDLLTFTDLGWTESVITAGIIAVFMYAYGESHSSVTGKLNAKYAMKGRIVNTSVGSGLVGFRVPMSASAYGSSLAYYLQSPVGMEVNSSDNTSSATAAMIGNFDLQGESDGLNTLIADMPCKFPFEGITSGTSTMTAYLSSTVHFVGAGRSYSFARATAASNVVLCSGTAHGSSNAAYSESFIFFNGESDGFSSAAGYLSSTMRLAGHVWCASFLNANMKRTKPLTGIAAGGNVAIGTAA